MTLGKTEETAIDDWISIERRKNERDNILQADIISFVRSAEVGRATRF